MFRRFLFSFLFSDRFIPFRVAGRLLEPQMSIWGFGTLPIGTLAVL